MTATKCAKCGTDTTHHMATFCANMKCAQVRPAGQLPICLSRRHHNHFCDQCAHAEAKA